MIHPSEVLGGSNNYVDGNENVETTCPPAQQEPQHYTCQDVMLNYLLDMTFVWEEEFPSNTHSTSY